MTHVLEWSDKEPEPGRTSSKGERYKRSKYYDELAEELRSKPNKWALVERAAKNHTRRQHVRDSLMKRLVKHGVVEVLQRQMNVWVKFVPYEET